FKLVGTPVTFLFREGANPYEGEKNVLTERQVKAKRRLIKHVKGRKRWTGQPLGCASVCRRAARMPLPAFVPASTRTSPARCDAGMRIRIGWLFLCGGDRAWPISPPWIFVN